MTDEARDKDLEEFCQREGIGSTLARVAARAAWNYLWAKWRTSEAEADRIARRVVHMVGHIETAMEFMSSIHAEDAMAELEQALKEPSDDDCEPPLGFNPHSGAEP